MTQVLWRYWRNKQLMTVPINAMATPHIQRAIRWLERNAISQQQRLQLTEMRSELKRRGKL